MGFQKEKEYISMQKFPNVIFESVFITGRGPCEVLPDGSRRWMLTYGFNVTTVIKGEVNVNYIEVNLYDKEKDSILEFGQGTAYTVYLNLSETQLKDIADTDTVFHYENALSLDKIVEIKKIEE